MKKSMLFNIFSALALFSSSTLYLAYAQPATSSIHPIETVCKNTYDRYTFPHLYGHIIGETSHKSCSGNGQNAWVTKILESGDTVCAVVMQDYRESNHIMLGYDVIAQGWTDTCPPLYEVGKLLPTNTLTLQLKEWASNYSCRSTPNRFIGTPVGYLNVGVGPLCEDLSGFTLLLKKPSIEEEACNPYRSGYIQKGHGIYLKKCDPSPYDNIDTYTNSHIKIPDDQESSVSLIGQTGLIYPYVANRSYEQTYLAQIRYGVSYYISGTPTYDIKRPVEDIEIDCKSIKVLPLGYRITGEMLSYQCKTNAFPNQYKANAWSLKKLGDSNEIICSYVNTESWTIFGQTIPISYTKVADVYDAHCPNPFNYPHNAWLIRRIADF